MNTTQPEALRVSGLLRVTGHKAVSANMISDAILVIESQHARITELESQLAQRFDAADMATAAAQGFRDGVASVSAGSEPVEWAIFAEGGNIRLWSKKPLLHPSAQPLYTHPAPTLTPGAAIAAGAVGVPRDELPECVIQLQEMWDTLEKKGKATSDDLIRWSNALSSVERALAQPAASHGQAPAGATLPDGWVPLTITHEGQYPEEVAYGPQIMMDRLGKWLGKYFAQAAEADSVQEDVARLDFLIDQGAYVVSDPDTCTGHWLHWARPDGSTRVQGDEHPTPRAAIDAARKQGGAT